MVSISLMSYMINFFHAVYFTQTSKIINLFFIRENSCWFLQEAQPFWIQMKEEIDVHSYVSEWRCSTMYHFCVSLLWGKICFFLHPCISLSFLSVEQITAPWRICVYNAIDEQNTVTLIFIITSPKWKDILSSYFLIDRFDIIDDAKNRYHS